MLTIIQLSLNGSQIRREDEKDLRVHREDREYIGCIFYNDAPVVTLCAGNSPSRLRSHDTRFYTFLAVCSESISSPLPLSPID